MGKDGGGGGRAAADRSKAPKKPGKHEDTLKAAPPVSVNADAATEAARSDNNSRREAAARAALRTAFGG